VTTERGEGRKEVANHFAIKCWSWKKAHVSPTATVKGGKGGKGSLSSSGLDKPSEGERDFHLHFLY